MSILDSTYTSGYRNKLSLSNLELSSRLLYLRPIHSQYLSDPMFKVAQSRITPLYFLALQMKYFSCIKTSWNPIILSLLPQKDDDQFVLHKFWVRFELFVNHLPVKSYEITFSLLLLVLIEGQSLVRCDQNNTVTVTKCLADVSILC